MKAWTGYVYPGNIGEKKNRNKCRRLLLSIVEEMPVFCVVSEERARIKGINFKAIDFQLE